MASAVAVAMETVIAWHLPGSNSPCPLDCGCGGYNLEIRTHFSQHRWGSAGVTSNLETWSVFSFYNQFLLFHNLPLLTRREIVLGLCSQPQAHLLCAARFGKWKPEASQRTFQLDSGVVPGHSARVAGNSGEVLWCKWLVWFILYLPHRVICRVFVCHTIAAYGDHHPPSKHTKRWQRASLQMGMRIYDPGKVKVFAVREPEVWILALRLVVVGKLLQLVNLSKLIYTTGITSPSLMESVMK